MPRKIDAGEVLAALGGLLAFVSLFLDWFDGFSGWTSFELADIVIALLALAAIGVAIDSVMGRERSALSRALPAIALVLLLIVVVQAIDPPPVFAGADPERDIGLWLALAGSLLILFGAFLRLARISVTIAVGGRDTRDRVPAVDRRRAPADAPAAAVAAPPADDDQRTQQFSALDEG